MTGTCCAFTGHRPHKLPWKHNEADTQCVALKAVLKERIIRLAGVGITDYYSGGVDGVDCMAAWIVLELRKRDPALSLHCIPPHEGQADRWSDSARERHHLILK